MKNEHQYYLDMCCRVKKFYRLNESKIDSIKTLTQLMVKLNALTNTLALEFENSITYFHGYSIVNARKRENLQKQCLKFSDHIREVQDNLKYNTVKELKRFVLLDPLELNLLDDEELIDYASGLYDLCTGMESRLKGIGVYQKAMETFAKYLTLFALDYPANQYSVTKRKNGNLQTLKAISDLNDLFEGKLDSAMSMIQGTDPELFRKYSDARKIKAPDLSKAADFEGVSSGGEVINVAELKYDQHREFLVVVTGGNAIWGLGKSPVKIDYGRPVGESNNLRISSRIVAPEGNFLNFQTVNPEQHSHYKIWVY
jgi:hypothetical protein